jgi:hypothetical protein
MTRDDILSLSLFFFLSSFGYSFWDTYIANMFAEVSKFHGFVWCLAMADLVLHYTHFKRRLVLDIVCGNTD